MVCNRASHYHLSATVLRRRLFNKKHLKNVGPIRHCEPPHADVYNNSDDDDDDNDNDNA